MLICSVYYTNPVAIAVMVCIWQKVAAIVFFFAVGVVVILATDGTRMMTLTVHVLVREKHVLVCVQTTVCTMAVTTDRVRNGKTAAHSSVAVKTQETSIISVRRGKLSLNDLFDFLRKKHH